MQKHRRNKATAQKIEDYARQGLSMRELASLIGLDRRTIEARYKVDLEKGEALGAQDLLATAKDLACVERSPVMLKAMLPYMAKRFRAETTESAIIQQLLKELEKRPPAKSTDFNVTLTIDD